jgi:5-methylcytosine-specific restriction endonuclease McrA
VTLANLCPDCGHPHDRRGRCAACARAHERARGSSTQRGLGADHRRIREQVLAEERLCWICGGHGTEDDPLTADHVLARVAGGRNVRANYRAAHASCNSRRGARVVGGGQLASGATSENPGSAFSPPVRVVDFDCDESEGPLVG